MSAPTIPSSSLPGRRRPVSCSLWAILALAAPLLMAPGLALADCADPPAVGVDWAGCEKHRLILRKADLRGAKFANTDLNGSDLEAANLSGADL